MRTFYQRHCERIVAVGFVIGLVLILGLSTGCESVKVTPAEMAAEAADLERCRAAMDEGRMNWAQFEPVMAAHIRWLEVGSGVGR